MLKCGILGEKLGHTYSPAIHAELADYEYKIYEVAPENLEDFILHGDWNGLNVTIPYKKAVIPYCTRLSELAEEIGSVNVLVKHADGTITGDNTDAFGFEQLAKRTGVELGGKKAIILGNGGACASVNAVLKRLGCSTTIISRSGEDNYENISRHFDAEVVANTTPVGMYPNTGKSVVDLTNFKNCKAVMELIYNPARTELILQAEELGIPCEAGLYMLVAQAKRAAELFTGQAIADSEIDRIEKKLSLEMQNIVLIGMPGCGKSTIAGFLNAKTGKPVVECDRLIAEKAGMSIPEIFEKYGEPEFRRIETEVLAECGKKSGQIISTGGGCVTIPENYKLLHQNGRIVWIKRDLSSLAKDGRPLSQKNGVEELFRKRRDLYAKFADFEVENGNSADLASRKILEELEK